MTEEECEIETSKAIMEMRNHIAELEKELKAEKEYSATLRKEIDEYTNSHTLCAKYKRLEEENAELKKQLEMSNKVYNDNLDYSHLIEEQLTEAKVALRNVIHSYNHKERFSFEKDLRKAEQFVNSEVEK